MLLQTGLLILIMTIAGIWELYLAWRKWNSFSEQPPEIIIPFIQDEDYKRLHINIIRECSAMAAKTIIKLAVNIWKLSVNFHQFVWDTSRQIVDDHYYHNAINILASLKLISTNSSLQLHSKLILEKLQTHSNNEVVLLTICAKKENNSGRMLLSTGVLIAFITLVHLWLLYLAWRRWNSFTKHPPDILTPFLPLEDYKRLRINVLKECSVMSAKIVLGLSINLWKLSISYQQLVWDAAKMLEYHNLPAAVWFVVLNTLITLSIEIPFEIMGLLFVSPDEYINIVAHFAQSMNNIGASCVLGGAAMWLAVFFQEQYNMYLVLVLANVFQFYNTITYIFHASIWLPLIARPLTDTFETERKIGELARKHGFPEKKILVDIEKNKEPSTYYYGIYGRFQLVVNLELTELINPQQTVALVAHELGRWKLNDNAYRMLFSVIEVIMFTILLYNSYNNPSIDKLFGFTTESKPHPLLRPYLARYFTWPVVYEAVRGPCNIYLSSLAYKADAWANQNGYGEELKAGLLAKIFHMATPEFDNLYSMWYWSQPSALKRVKHITKIPPTTIDSSTAEESSSSQMKKNK